jgi:antitoxin (DNA-binding transcriptional repressor) of toxin-antitoxin stability system|tara:strand:+ start:84 stop:362 length:279 start_codon:yes stop_codon:yes gene_type:complete
MKTTLIELTIEEVKQGFDLCLTMVERGHTIKIVQEGKPSVLMVPVPEYVNNYAQANEELPEIPMPSDWQPDPVGVKQYVTEELNSIQKELNS